MTTKRARSSGGRARSSQPRRAIGSPMESEDAARPAPAQQQAQKKAIRVDEAAQLLSVSERFVYNLCRRGELASIRDGNKVIIPMWALDQWLLARAGRSSSREV